MFLKSEDVLQFQLVGMTGNESSGFSYVYTTLKAHSQLECVQSGTERSCTTAEYSTVSSSTISSTAIGRSLQ